jgi:hypothetical protein
MKKLALSLAVVAMAAFTMTSCKKEYTCECCVDFLGTKTCASTTIKDTKKKAEDACTASATSGVATSSCAIK